MTAFRCKRAIDKNAKPRHAFAYSFAAQAEILGIYRSATYATVMRRPGKKTHSPAHPVGFYAARQNIISGNVIRHFLRKANAF